MCFFYIFSCFFFLFLYYFTCLFICSKSLTPQGGNRPSRKSLLQPYDIFYTNLSPIFCVISLFGSRMMHIFKNENIYCFRIESTPICFKIHWKITYVQILWYIFLYAFFLIRFICFVLKPTVLQDCFHFSNFRFNRPEVKNSGVVRLKYSNKWHVQEWDVFCLV